MKLSVLILMLIAQCATADSLVSYTDFFCNNNLSGTSNLWAGSTSTASPVYQAANGNWNGTSIYTPTDGSTPANTVSAGMWASVFLDGSIVAVYVARVTTVAAGVNGAITLSTGASAGTAPTSGGTGRSIAVGGCWHGPGTGDQLGGQGGTTNSFPIGFFAQTLTNSSQFAPRCNFKGGTTYSITNVMIQNNTGPMIFEGYTTSVGDGGKATFDGGTTGTSFSLLRIDAGKCSYIDLIFNHNGNSGASCIVTNGAGGNQFYKGCVFANGMGSGYHGGLAFQTLVECEACTNNQSNTSGFAGFRDAGSESCFIRCKSHDNSGNNTVGFQTGESVLIDCISTGNGSHGLNSSSTSWLTVKNCDFRGNSGSAINLSSATVGGILYIENTDLFKSTANGIAATGTSAREGAITYYVSGTGTEQNTSGDLANNIQGNKLNALFINHGISFPSNLTPWVDPANGNFTLSQNTTNRATGAGVFTEFTLNSPTNTVSYPDIGAAQAASTNGGFAAGYAQ